MKCGITLLTNMNKGLSYLHFATKTVFPNERYSRDITNQIWRIEDLVHTI